MCEFNYQLVYPGEHLHCHNYSKNNSESIVETIDLKSGEVYRRKIKEPEIYMILDGGIILSDRDKKETLVKTGNMFVLPPGEYVHIETTVFTSILIMRLKSQVNLCETLNIAKLEYFEEGVTDNLSIIAMNDAVINFAATFVPMLQSGLRCKYYLSGKITELMFYFRAYYTKEEMASFFRPMLGSNLIFRSFVLANINQNSSTEQLAILANMSRNGFCSKFKKIMGETPTSYIIGYRASGIRHELLCSAKTYKTISAEFGFSSLNLFTRFCRKHLGAPPGRIRKEGMIEKE